MLRRRRGWALWLVRLPRVAKRGLALLADSLMCLLTVWLALCLRLESWVVLASEHWIAVGVSVLLALPIFIRNGLYAGVFRFAGWQAAVALMSAMVWYGLLYMVVFTVVRVPGVPRTVGVIQPLLLLVGVGASRLAVRLVLGDLYRRMRSKSRAPGVLIYGAGEAGRQLASALRQSADHRLVGFVDDNPRLQGRQLDTVPVYAPQQLAQVMERQRVADVLLALPSTRRERRLEIVDFLREYPVHVRTLPGLAALADGRVSLGDLHELDIEDLLGRDPVAPDASLMEKHLRGKVVLVTGAGGSIGRELCRQIVQCGPRRLLLLEQGEFALYRVQQDLQARLTQLVGPLPELVPVLGSVQDEQRLAEVMAAWRPDTVYHAAAYKHVPLVEQNMAEGLRNNVWGTWVCARQAAAHGVRNFVLVSTDKAVRPTNVMGASKRLAELVLQALAREAACAGTCFTMVRFGNVLGSSGSVVPLFRRQIAQRKPITLTHPKVTRYFMTIPEAAQLVIQAGALAEGGEVFVLDMGEPVCIADLARRMVELSGLRVRDTAHPMGDIEIQITGLRPGEKLYEELLIGDDTQTTPHPRILRANESFLPWDELLARLQQLDHALKQRDLDSVRGLLLELVTGYQPANELVDNVYLESHAQDEPAQDDSSDEHAAGVLAANI